ncbi:SRPBCC domain-containing protein [Salininema proteolyticum]|uniref:SRPBCC domain-containing protein n=1 Tax=Salininema proteolyticum TaxID=1607685 RepID=A0ABV8U3F5_9ACTN
MTAETPSEGMSSTVHVFDPRAGGAFRISLTYADEGQKGKSEAHTDTYRGTFLALVPDVEVVEEFSFETGDDALRGTMTMTTSLEPVAGGTEVTILHENVPDAIPPEQNDQGMTMALDNLARLVEEPQGPNAAS